MTTFVNLTPDVRTYIASVKVNPHFESALAAGTREGRKAAAYNAMIAAEKDTSTALVPKLDALKAQGLLSSYELVAGTGAIILNVPKDKAGAGFDALRGVAELNRIVRNRAVTLDDVTTDPTPPAPTPPAPTPPAPTPPAPTPPPTVTTEYNVTKLGVQKLWDAGVTGKGVVVGFVDTGANTMHAALKAKYRGTKADGTQDHNYNFFDPVNGKKDAYDDHNHGSHVAGTTLGGTADRLIGMAPGAQFISTKVFTAGGSGSTATILKGLGWMLAPTDSNGANADPTKAPDIVSNSWGNSNGASLSYIDAWKAFEAAGIVPVVAAGNSGPRPKTIGAPGSYPQSLTVGATDRDDKIAGFSSRGPSPIKDADGKELQKPDFSAPGKDITSAGKTGDAYVTMSGTSMATPAAAGVIALLLSKYPQLKTEQIRDILSKSALDLGTPGWDADFGNGRLDAPAALAAADKLFAPPSKPEPPK